MVGSTISRITLNIYLDLPRVFLPIQPRQQLVQINSDNISMSFDLPRASGRF